MAFYWYQSDPQLYQAEVAAMQKFFHPSELTSSRMVLADYIGVVKFSQWVKVEWFGINVDL